MKQVDDNYYGIHLTKKDLYRFYNKIELLTKQEIEEMREGGKSARS